MITCGACGVQYSHDDWLALAVRDRIEPAEVSRLVSAWPENVCVEVRSCRGCGRSIATKAPALARHSSVAAAAYSTPQSI